MSRPASESMPWRDDPAERVIAAVTAIATKPELVRVFVVEGEPLPKARPRFVGRSRRGRPIVRNSKRQLRNQELLSWRLRSEFSEPMEGPLVVGLAFYRSTQRRVDIDNLLKFCFDAGNKIIWRDDSQIMETITHLEKGSDHPRTVFAVAPMA